MHYTKASERDLELVIMVSRGTSLSLAGRQHGITTERVRQIILRFCRSYLSHAWSNNTPENFYPGPDLQIQMHYHEPMYNNEAWNDYSTRIHNYQRLVAKGLAVERVDNVVPYPDISGMEELRQYSDWWVHQIELLRRDRARPKSQHRRVDFAAIVASRK